MKAAVLTGYDKNGRDLELREFPVPAPAAGEVLVKVHAAGVNPLDNMIVKGEVKLIVPYPFPLVMGNEVVGTVEALGPARRVSRSASACTGACRSRKSGRSRSTPP